MKLRYTEPADEVSGKNGETIKNVRGVSYEDIDHDGLTDVIGKLEAKGYDVEVSLKLKIPKD